MIGCVLCTAFYCVLCRTCLVLLSRCCVVLLLSSTSELTSVVLITASAQVWARVASRGSLRHGDVEFEQIRPHQPHDRERHENTLHTSEDVHAPFVWEARAAKSIGRRLHRVVERRRAPFQIHRSALRLRWPAPEYAARRDCLAH